MIREISSYANQIHTSVQALIHERTKANALEIEKRAEAYSGKVKPAMDKVRGACDALELITDDTCWPLPKMRELLFTR